MEPIKNIDKNYYHNSKKQKELFRNASKMFEEIDANDDKEQPNNYIIQ